MSWFKAVFGYSDSPCCDVFGIGGASQAVGNVAAAGIQSGAVLGAAGIQAGAINHATDEQAKSANNALDFTKQTWQQDQNNQAPYREAGQNAITGISTGLNLGGQNVPPSYFTQGYGQTFNPTTFSGSYTPQTVSADNPNPAFASGMNSLSDFQAPNTQTAAFDPSSINLKDDPGYQFRLQQGNSALANALASQGVSGGAQIKAAVDYNSGAASQEYQNAYGRALSTSQQNQSINAQNYGQAANTYGVNANTHQLNYEDALQGYQVNAANTQQNFANQVTAAQANNASGLNAYNAQLAQNNQNNNWAQQGFNTNYNVHESDVNNLWNRFASVAGYGQTANAQLGQGGAQAANQVGNIQGQLGNAYSAGAAAQGNVWGGAVQNLGNIYGNYQMSNQLKNAGGSGNIYTSYPGGGDDEWSTFG